MPKQKESEIKLPAPALTANQRWNVAVRAFPYIIIIGSLLVFGGMKLDRYYVQQEQAHDTAVRTEAVASLKAN